MRCLLLCLVLALAACGPRAAASEEDGNESAASPPDTPLRPASTTPEAARGQWQGRGGDLQFVDADNGLPTMMISCAHGRLGVSLPGVAPIGSEERLSFGGGGEVETMVAAPGPAGRTVVASGPAPDGEVLRSLMAGGPGASYGASAVGPLVPVPPAMIDGFVTACGQAGGT